MFYYVLGKDNFRNSLRHLIQIQSLPRYRGKKSSSGNISSYEIIIFLA